MTASETSGFADVPHRFWSVLDIIEEISFSMFEHNDVETALVRDWLRDVARHEPAALIDCLEDVAVAVDYVDTVLAALMAEPGQVPTPEPSLPLSRAERRTRMERLIREQTAREDRPGAVDSLGLGAGQESEPAPSPTLVRWAIRHALGLVESAVAATGPGSGTALDAVSSKAIILGREETLRVLDAIETIEAAVIFLVAALGA